MINALFLEYFVLRYSRRTFMKNCCFKSISVFLLYDWHVVFFLSLTFFSTQFTISLTAFLTMSSSFSVMGIGFTTLAELLPVSFFLQVSLCRPYLCLFLNPILQLSHSTVTFIWNINAHFDASMNNSFVEAKCSKYLLLSTHDLFQVEKNQNIFHVLKLKLYCTAVIFNV